MASVETVRETTYRLSLSRAEMEALRWSLQVAINQGATPSGDLIQLQNTIAGALNQ